jgi:hypothetical protein
MDREDVSTLVINDGVRSSWICGPMQRSITMPIPMPVRAPIPVPASGSGISARCFQKGLGSYPSARPEDASIEVVTVADYVHDHDRVNEHGP